MLPIPHFVRPIARKLIGLPGRLIPYPAQKRVLSVALNQAFRDPFQHGEFEFLDGARVRIKVTDMNVDWLIKVGAERFTPVPRELTDDVCISGESLGFVLLATRQVDPDSLFFQRRIRIEGDTELGLGVKNTMDGMDWDDLPPALRRLLEAVSFIVRKLQQNSTKTEL